MTEYEVDVGFYICIYFWFVYLSTEKEKETRQIEFITGVIEEFNWCDLRSQNKLRR